VNAPRPDIGAPDWDGEDIRKRIAAALAEDLGSGDLTAEAIVPEAARATARLFARQTLVLAGLPLFERVFRALSGDVSVECFFSDGQEVRRDAVLAHLKGPARAILSAERTALNFLAHLSGIATLTRRFSDAIAGTSAFIRDTRKTTPTLRALEKYAVRAGGGRNHRFGLFDAILIKENHIAIAGSVAEALRRARAATASGADDSPEMTAYESFRPPADAGRPRQISIQVEVRNEAEMREALAAGAESVLLDNAPPVEAARLIEIARRLTPGCVIEISGGVNLSNVRAYAEAGADYISVGAITHSAPAADLSLLVDLSGVE
jgi:nicotinate-nucleotide pyrophosphorylase (carboxylating)